MRIVLTSSEAVPFSKTGGLADVSSALPKALANLGHDLWLITPYYPQQAEANGLAKSIHSTGKTITISVGHKDVSARVLESTLPGTSVRVYLVDQPDYFDRTGLYGDAEGDYRDSCERFVFLSRAVLEISRLFGINPDVIHANDWQTGIIPALLRIEGHKYGLERTASVYTIHNMAFQGQFWHWDMLLTGLDWKYFNWRQMEFHGQLNLLKTGITFADMLTTVSPTYAREIQTAEFGYGLNGVLTSRREDLVGILNGIDEEVWNPATDPLIPERYDHNTVSVGKPVCKVALQKAMGLPVHLNVPVLGMISRITSQKGLDLILGCSRDLADLNVQCVFLGTGDPVLEKGLMALAKEHPHKFAVKIGYDEVLSHQIEAGSDMFLMPSQFEPCGLNQMYSLAYGTVPIVRAVGGLADSVIDVTEANLGKGNANGFSFYEYKSEVLFRQICRTLGYFLDKTTWLKLQKTGMTRDWSWRRSAQEYLNVYQQACIKKSHGH